MERYILSLKKIVLIPCIVFSLHLIPQCPQSITMMRRGTVHMPCLPRYSPESERCIGLSCTATGGITGVTTFLGGTFEYLSLITTFKTASTALAWTGIIGVPPLIVGSTAVLSMPCVMLGLHYYNAHEIRTTQPPENSSLIGE